MVGRADLMNAIALNSSAFNIARIVGPGIGGIVIGVAGVAAAFFINSASFLAVIAGLLAMRKSELHHVERGAKESVWAGMRGGLDYVRSSTVVYVSILLVGIVAMFGMNYTVLLPGMARDLFQVGSTGFGLLMSSIGVGSLIAALVIAFFQRLDPIRLMVRGAAGFSILTMAFALSPKFPSLLLVGLHLVATGFCMICLTATANTNLQRTTPDRLRGRVMSIYITIFAGTTPLGSLFAGWLAGRWGAHVALLVGGLAAGIATVWAWQTLRKAPGSDPSAIETSEARRAASEPVLPGSEASRSSAGRV
jgi:predicted MFS family arabinose efflux permease